MKGAYTLEVDRRALKCKLIENGTEKSQEYTNPDPFIFDMCINAVCLRCAQAGFSVIIIEK